MNGVIYIVATPIGNLGDITLRSLDTLKSVDYIFCEDTRTSKKLLAHYNISKQTISLHKFNELQNTEKIHSIVLSGNSIAIISDAGTPCVSDPGSYIVGFAHKNNIKIVPIPGPSSLSASISVSGFTNNNKILFLGFLPHKPSQVKKLFLEISSYNIDSIIFFESAKRIVSSINLLKEIFPDAVICTSRELSKIYEEILRFDANSVPSLIEKGEYTVSVKLNHKTINVDSSDKLPKQLATYLGIETKLAYKLINKLKEEYKWSS